MSNLKQLREQFDRVIIKYSEKSCEVMLIDGLNAFSGVSKCHENDNFNKKLGRTIALGRAEHAFKIVREAAPERSSEFSEGGYKYKIAPFDSKEEVDAYIQEFLPNKKSQEAS